MLTSKQYASVMVIDVDQKGEDGGHPENLTPLCQRRYLGTRTTRNWASMGRN